jgi:predicted acyl esterase
VRRAFLAAVASACAVLAAAGPAAAFSKQDLFLPMDDGAVLSASLYLPDGAAPAGGWPAVVLMHGLGGDRSSMNTLAESMGLAGEQYAALTFDARGHGLSGGLIGIDGPREIADARAVHAWLAARPDVADAKIGAWGISYGGGAALNSLAAGVPWAAVEVAETWSDLMSALVPQGLAKSGVIGGYVASLPPARVDPAVFALRDAAFAGRIDEVRAFAAQRSSLSGLTGSRTPVFLMQGRRDFVFGLDQATRLYKSLAGPRRLWIGNHGHAPSTFPASDSAEMLRQGMRWFDRFLRGTANGIDRDSRPVTISHQSGSGVTAFAAVPNPARRTFALPGSRAIDQSGRVQRTTGPLATAVDTFGAPIVRVTATSAGGWTRLVAVLTATTPQGQTILVSGGGLPVRTGTRSYAISLIDQSTRIPKGSRFTVTLASSSLAQNPGNLLYLNLPMPASSRITLRSATLTVPVLRATVPAR